MSIELRAISNELKIFWLTAQGSWLMAPSSWLRDRLINRILYFPSNIHTG